MLLSDPEPVPLTRRLHSSVFVTHQFVSQSKTINLKIDCELEGDGSGEAQEPQADTGPVRYLGHFKLLYQGNDPHNVSINILRKGLG